MAFLELLGSLGSAVAGDLITKFTERTDGMGSKSQGSLAPGATSYEAMLQGQKDALGNYSKFMDKGMYSAAGTIGKNETQRMFEQKTNELSNSANAYNASNALNQDANTLRSAALQTGTDAVRNNQLNQKGQRRGVLNALLQNGGNRGSIAAAVNQLNEGTVAGNQQVLSQSNEAMRANIAAAGTANTQAQGILDQNLDLRSKIYRDPYKAEIKDPAQALAASVSAGNAAGQQYSNAQAFDQERSSQFRGTQGFFGGLSGALGGAGSYEGLFGKDYKVKK